MICRKGVAFYLKTTPYNSTNFNNLKKNWELENIDIANISVIDKNGIGVPVRKDESQDSESERVAKD